MTKKDHRQILERVIKVLLDLRDDLHNRSPINPRKRTAPPTRLVRAKIRNLHREGHSQQEISQRLKISIGRVSETLRGKRK